MTSMTPEAHPPLSRRMVALIAIGCGVSVANNYYNQPLLREMARGVGAPELWGGYLPALTQAGFALGLFLLVPLGDLFERRGLVVIMLGLAAAMLIGVAVSPTFPALAAASFATGLAGIAPQLLVPFAAHLAPAADRGRVVGAVMGGLLTGVLLARTLSGFVGQLLGWRAVYWLAAALTVGLLLVLRAALPESRPAARLRYRDLMRSMAGLIREEPALRQSCLFGAATFGSFGAFWSTLAFLLAGPPFGYGSEVVGLFGVVGVAAAPLVGRAGDRGDPRRMVALGAAITALSFAVSWLGGHSLWALAAGVVLMDLGVQVAHVSNQTRVYGLRPDARNRLNSVYMVAYFIGGGVGSSLGAAAWTAAGWRGVCAVGFLLPALALAASALSEPGRMRGIGILRRARPSTER